MNVANHARRTGFLLVAGLAAIPIGCAATVMDDAAESEDAKASVAIEAIAQSLKMACTPLHSTRAHTAYCGNGRTAVEYQVCVRDPNASPGTGYWSTYAGGC